MFHVIKPVKPEISAVEFSNLFANKGRVGDARAPIKRFIFREGYKGSFKLVHYSRV